MRTLLHRLALSFALVAFLLPDRGIAASSPYVQATEGLDLNRVRFAISAPPEFISQLVQRVTALFAEAGLPPLRSDSPPTPFIATLTLTLTPQPLSDACPGHVLYSPSLALTEPVIIPRNSAVINDVTWLAHTGAQVRRSVTVTDLERDLEEFINQFIADYRTTNGGGRSSLSGDGPATPHPDAPLPGSVLTAPDDVRGDSTLKALRIDQLQISVSAGRFSHALTARALQQFNNAGLALSPGQHHNGQLTLGVELIQQPLEDRCPGKVLYESGLYLVEHIQLTRNQRVSIWSDTWLRETAQVVAPQAQAQLESDQDALLRQFINSLKTH